MKISRQRLFFMGYVALVFAILATWFLHTRLVGSRAAGDNINITFTPTVGTFGINAQQDLDIILQTADGTKKISGIDLTLNATGPIKFTNITDPVPFPGTDTSLFNKIVQTVADQKIHISYVSLKTDIELPSVIKIRVSYLGTATGTGVISIDQSNTQIVGNIVGKQYSLGTVDQGTYTFSEQGSANVLSARILPPSFQIDMNQPDPSMRSFDVAITDVPTGSRISGYHFILKFDPSLINVASISTPIDAATGTDSQKFTQLKQIIDNSAGTIELAYISTLPQDQLPTRPKQTITVVGKKIGVGDMSFTSQEITGNIAQNVYQVNTYNGTYTVINSAAISVTPAPTQLTPTPIQMTPAPTEALSPTIPISLTVTGVPTCNVDTECADNQICSSHACVTLPCQSDTSTCIRTIPRNHSCVIDYLPDTTACGIGGVCVGGICTQPTITVTPVPGNITMNLKLKFQGILKKPATPLDTMQVKVSLGGKLLGTVIKSQTVTFTADDQGIWSGAATFNAPVGDGYKVYIKGAQHLQKKICDASPAETSSGTYRCGDIGVITLANGTNDLDFSHIIQLSGDLPDQDGVVDAYDIAYIRLNLGSTDTKSLATGDLNRDGLVDTQDYSLLIASLNVKYDEL